MKNTIIYIYMVLLGATLVFYYQMTDYKSIDLFENLDYSANTNNGLSGLITNLFFIVSVLIPFYHVFQKKIIIPKINILFLTILMYFAFNNLIFSKNTNEFLQWIKGSTTWILLFLNGYYIACTDNFIERFQKTAIYFSLIFLGICLYDLFTKVNFAEIITGSILRDKFFMYYSLLPIVLFIRNKKIKYFLLSVLSLILLSSFKRSLIIGSISATFLYLISTAIIEKKSKPSYYATLIIFSVLIFLIFGYINSESDNYMFIRFDSILEDGGSGRNDIYSNVWLFFRDNSNAFNQLFGNGFKTVKSIFNVSAHNDILELLIDYGILSIVLYALIIKQLVSYIMLMYKKVFLYKEELPVFLAIFILWLAYSMLNAAIFSKYMYLLIFALGLCIGNFHYKERKQYGEKI